MQVASEHLSLLKYCTRVDDASLKSTHGVGSIWSLVVLRTWNDTGDCIGGQTLAATECLHIDITPAPGPRVEDTPLPYCRRSPKSRLQICKALKNMRRWSLCHVSGSPDRQSYHSCLLAIFICRLSGLVSKMLCCKLDLTTVDARKLKSGRPPTPKPKKQGKPPQIILSMFQLVGVYRRFSVRCSRTPWARSR